MNNSKFDRFIAWTISCPGCFPCIFLRSSRAFCAFWLSHLSVTVLHLCSYFTSLSPLRFHWQQCHHLFALIPGLAIPSCLLLTRENPGFHGGIPQKSNGIARSWWSFMRSLPKMDGFLVATKQDKSLAQSPIISYQLHYGIRESLSIMIRTTKNWWWISAIR